ncbi:MAG: sigma-70 family RNA polymerase sigma factor [Chloroflexi bacterium]|nr:sigma-70 family RNA polymerase sigma factor [Chloroflexota bacterium]
MPKSAPVILASPKPSLDTLMTQHDGLVHAVLRRQWGGTLSYEQRLHAGRIGLWQALQGYDPNRGTAFSTYAWTAIARQVWRAVRLAAPKSVPSPSFASPPPDSDEALLHEEVLHTLDTLVAGLPAQLRQVVTAYYGLADEPSHSLRQIGRQIGLSHEAVRLRLWAALVWLRHPAHSLPLRQLLDMNSAIQYQRADDLAQAWLRKRGGRRAH